MSKEIKTTPEEDATNPYPLGEPMGWLGTTIFCLIMFGGIVVAIYLLAKGIAK